MKIACTLAFEIDTDEYLFPGETASHGAVARIVRGFLWRNDCDAPDSAVLTVAGTIIDISVGDPQ